jgi:hypothetical protein
MHTRFADALRLRLRLMLLLALLLPFAALVAPRAASAQGPGTEYIACIDRAEDDLATCYWLAEDRWRERLCNFAYYVDSIACSVDLIF